MNKIHPQQDRIASFLQRTAAELLENRSFVPFGASLGPNDELTLELVPPTGDAFQTRKALHARLVAIAKSGQATAVGLCHSLEHPSLGQVIVMSVDHGIEESCSVILRLNTVGSQGTVFMGEPIVQPAAYAFFRYVNVDEASAHLIGRWSKMIAPGAEPEVLEFSANGHFSEGDTTGRWRADPGDFFTVLLQASTSRTRSRRINALTDRRLVLQEVVDGAVYQAEYERTSLAQSDKKPWWKLW